MIIFIISLRFRWYCNIDRLLPMPFLAAAFAAFDAARLITFSPPADIDTADADYYFHWYWHFIDGHDADTPLLRLTLLRDYVVAIATLILAMMRYYLLIFEMPWLIADYADAAETCFRFSSFFSLFLSPCFRHWFLSCHYYAERLYLLLFLCHYYQLIITIFIFRCFIDYEISLLMIIAITPFLSFRRVSPLILYWLRYFHCWYFRWCYAIIGFLSPDYHIFAILLLMIFRGHILIADIISP